MLSGTNFRAQLVIHEQREVYDYWLGRAGERPMPSRADIKPEHLTRYLPSISLIEPGPGLDRTIVRLAGTKLREIYGVEPTRKSVAEITAGSSCQYWQDVYARLVETGRPMHGAIRGPVAGREHIVMFWLKLPLSDGDGVNRILCHDSALPAVGQFGEPSPHLVPPLAAPQWPLRRRKAHAA